MRAVPDTTPDSTWRQADAVLTPCAECGTLFQPYNGVHRYCTDKCGKRRRHVLAGNLARKPRYIGTCLRCGRRLTKIADATWHKACVEAKRAALSHPSSPPPVMPMVRRMETLAIPGAQVDTVWNGSSGWVNYGFQGAKGRLMPPVAATCNPWER